MTHQASSTPDGSTPERDEPAWGRLEVAITPDMRSINPYQGLLSEALESRGIRVRFPEELGGRRPLVRGLVGRQFQVVHLDWIHPYVAAETRLRFWLRSGILVSKLLLARLVRRRIVWTVHNLTSHDSPFQLAERRVGRMIAAVSHTLIVHFPAAEQLVRSDIGVAAGKKIWVAPHGNYMDVYQSGRSRTEKAQRTGSRTFVFLAFGLVRPYKRLEELIEAFRHLDREDISLSIRGMAHDEEYAAGLLHLAEDDPRIELDLGFVHDDSVPDVFDAADAVALPQRDTLTSGSLILAMSMGKAVVAARTPHAEYLLGEGPHLYRPGDPADLARALEDMVVRRDEVSEEGDANQRTIAKYTWNDMAEVVEKAYRPSAERRP